jgi:hypothetical protein
LYVRPVNPPVGILNEVAAFKAFVTDIGSRCDEPPVVTELAVVGSYDFGS